MSGSSGVSFSSMFPELPLTHADEAVAHVADWFEGFADDTDIGLFLLPSRRFIPGPLAGVLRLLREGGLDSLINGEEGSGSLENVYLHVGAIGLDGRGRLPENVTTGRDGARFAHRPGRPRDANITWVPGLWAELDIKPGAFASRAHCDLAVEKLRAAGLAPSIVVRSGGGGLHLYWKVRGGLKGPVAADWSLRMRLWIESVMGVALDNVAQPSRVLRLAGSLWIRSVVVESPEGWRETRDDVREVRLESVAVAGDGAEEHLDLAFFEVVSAEVWAEHLAAKEAERAAAAAAARERRAHAEEVLAAGVEEGWVPPALMTWSQVYRWVFMEDAWCDSVSWEEILVPFGFVETTPAGVTDERQWRRPLGPGEDASGVSPRSLVTDWVGSSGNVASMFTEDAGGGSGAMARLQRVRARGERLTKLNAAAALWELEPVEILRRSYMRKDWKDGGSSE